MQVRIHGFAIESNPPAYFAELSLDIDFPKERTLDADRRFKFLLAPAIVIFANVSGLRIDADSGRFEPGLMVINDARWEPIDEESAPGRVPMFRWKFVGDWFELAFATTGGSLEMKCEPVPSDEAWFTREKRLELLGL
jgi:hypothetical protein